MVLHDTYGEDNLFSVSHCKSSRLTGNPRRIQSLPSMITTVTGVQIPHHSSESDSNCKFKSTIKDPLENSGPLIVRDLMREF